jgi:hypothetical protein
MDAATLLLTSNCETVYGLCAIDLKRDGPVVIEAEHSAALKEQDARRRYKRRASRGDMDQETNPKRDSRVSAYIVSPEAAHRRPRVVQSVAPSMATLMSIHVVAHTQDGSRKSRAMVAASD